MGKQSSKKTASGSPSCRSCCQENSNSNFLRLLRHDPDAYRSCEDIDIAERDYRLLAGLVLAKKRENIGIAVLNGANISDYPLASAICLADDPLADKILKLASALLEI